jgi:cytochrome c oxidase subunit 4
MTADTEEVVATPAEHDADHIKHPTPKQYWLIALILAVVTALEIAASYVEALDGPVLVITLLGLGAIKFGMVVALFMHLKFDKPLYRGFFLIGLVGAIAMFVVVLLTFRAL